jgi:hypothetical protein
MDVTGNSLRPASRVVTSSQKDRSTAIGRQAGRETSPISETDESASLRGTTRTV